MSIRNICYRAVTRICLFLCVMTSHAGSLQTPAIHQHQSVILIHGLMRTTTSMVFLKHYLKKQGYQAYSYSYPSARGSIQEHSVFLTQYIKQFIEKHPQDALYVVTHSMGGIIARESLASLSPDQLTHIGGLIMLAPPNQGSVLAQASTKMLPMVSYFVKPLEELSAAQDSYVHQVPIPKVKIRIIAGRYDAKVPPRFARLEGQKAPVVVNSTHTFIMNNSKTKQLISRFLERGDF